MAFHLDLGKKGEDIAAAFLEAKGYQLLHRNWKQGRREIDLIARQGDYLVFIEVKTRHADALSFPEAAVGAAKQGHLAAAAEYFLEQYALPFTDIRFDIIAITFRDAERYELLHFDDAF